MRQAISDGVISDHPGIEDLLWRVAVYSCENDPDITLTGLYLQVRRSPDHLAWSGKAWPKESSGGIRRISHPAGRINLCIGADVPDKDIIRLFAHELRHIGQFHRGRKVCGFLGTYPLDNDEVEPDALRFELDILNKILLPIPKKYKGRSTHEELATNFGS